MKFLPLIFLPLLLTGCDKISSALNLSDPTPAPTPIPTPVPYQIPATPAPHSGDWMWKKDGHNPLDQPAQKSRRGGQQPNGSNNGLNGPRGLN